MRTRLAAIILFAAAATLLTSSAFARGEALRAPAGLKPFLLRANEPVTHEFPRSPSFSWAPVRGALRYQFQLAKNVTFTESSIFWSHGNVRGPAVAVPLALPWMTGSPYAAYARVRAVTNRGLTAWSAPFGFNLRWKDLPQQLPGYTGLSRWSTVEGATGYEVWFTKIGPNFVKRVTTRTNAVDHREAYAFHEGNEWTGEVRWRVRAIRTAAETQHLNGLPAVSYGPWSKEFVSNNNPMAAGSLRPLVAVTNGATSKAGDAREHELTPAFAWTGREALNTAGAGSFGLYRVYISTDSDCVNTIFKGAIVGSPAYAPRTSGPLKLPIDPDKDLAAAVTTALDSGTETNTFAAGVVPVSTTEQPETGSTAPGSGSSGSGSAGSGSATGTTAPTPAVDLPESGWPNGRFYWTVVPVYMARKVVQGKEIIEYHEIMPPQDQCQRGNFVQFGKDSSPVLAGQGTPYASGLSPKGRLVAASGQRVTFYGHPLVAWAPVQGAAGYEVQWSPTREEWRTRGTIETEGTAAVLPVKPGTWFYRVRARNPYLPGVVKRMAWSTPHRIVVAKPRFAVVRG
jgi:hypothetical protein